jgi:hypothetical protein
MRTARHASGRLDDSGRRFVLCHQPYRRWILRVIKSGFFVSHFSGQAPPMLLQNSIASGEWRLLEEVYLDSASKHDAGDYTSLSEAEKHTALLALADTKAAVSKRSAEIVADPRVIGLTR